MMNPNTMIPGPTRVVCKYFAQSGNCLRGDKCHFLHIAESTAKPGGPPPPPQQQLQPQQSSQQQQQHQQQQQMQSAPVRAGLQIVAPPAQLPQQQQSTDVNNPGKKILAIVNPDEQPKSVQQPQQPQPHAHQQQVQPQTQHPPPSAGFVSAAPQFTAPAPRGNNSNNNMGNAMNQYQTAGATPPPGLHMHPQQQMFFGMQQQQHQMMQQLHHHPNQHAQHMRQPHISHHMPPPQMMGGSPNRGGGGGGGPQQSGSPWARRQAPVTGDFRSARSFGWQGPVPRQAFGSPGSSGNPGGGGPAGFGMPSEAEGIHYSAILPQFDPDDIAAYGKKFGEEFFVDEQLAETLSLGLGAARETAEHDDRRQTVHHMPPVIDKYHSLAYLDPFQRMMQPSVVYAARTSLYKGICALDGNPYVLRRIDTGNHVATPLVENAMRVVNACLEIDHPAIIPLREVFVSKQVLSSEALYFVHDYIFGASTIYDTFAPTGPPTEHQLWDFVVQLASVIFYFFDEQEEHPHRIDFALCRGLFHPSKLLLTQSGQIKLCGIGIVEALRPIPRGPEIMTKHRDQMREEIRRLGLLTLYLSLLPASYEEMDPEHAFEQLVASNFYSKSFTDFVYILLSQSHAFLSGEDLLRYIPRTSAKLLNVSNRWLQLNEWMMTEMTKGVLNDRYMKILMQLCMVHNRPRPLGGTKPQHGAHHGAHGAHLAHGGAHGAHSSHGHRTEDPSLTSDQHILDLFFHYVFHQVDEFGHPVPDWGHIMHNLEQLYLDSRKKILLTSEDNQTAVLVSYHDVGKLLDKQIHIMLTSATPPNPF